jgi:hypothetical protein
MSKITTKQRTYPTKPLQPYGSRDVVIYYDHNQNVVQYEFYIPAAIWDHSAVRNFITKLGQLDPNATIF